MQAIFEEAFKFAFKDRSWILKILIGGILGMIPIVNIVFLVGYSYCVLKDSVDNKPPVLPEWSGWKEYGRNGLYGLLIVFVYVLFPSLVLAYLTRIAILKTICIVGLYLINLITIPLFVLAMIAWYRKGTLNAAFAIKDIWQAFVNNAQNYLVGMLLLAIVPFLVTLILIYTGPCVLRYGVPSFLFPGAFIQFLLNCLWFWLGIVGARALGQIYITAQT